MRTIHIYRLRVRGTGKDYIGTTKMRGFRREIIDQAFGARNKTPLQRDICKSASEDISIEVLEVVTEETAKDRWLHWVIEFNTFEPNGYNYDATKAISAHKEGKA